MVVRAETVSLRELLALQLEDARERTLALIAPVEEADLRKQHSPLMGPILWDLGHIAAFEELWLLRNQDGPPRFSAMPGLYDPFAHPRAVRGGLPLPSLEATLAHMAAVRERVLERLDLLDLDAPDPLLRGGYVHRMVLQHEYQHNETILQTLQLKTGLPYRAPRAAARVPPPAAAAPGGMVLFPGGEVEIGTDDRTTAYDNERPKHQVVLRPFRIDVAPVTNGAYLEFMADGGYSRRELWSEAGWRWLREAGASAPAYWWRTAYGWVSRSMDLVEPVDPDRPVCHVCWYEAEAFARWAGKRLPTEEEWEAAATWDPATGEKRLFPWGDEPPAAIGNGTGGPVTIPTDANLDQLSFGTTPVGTYPRNVSPIGCHDMIGNVWEWTASPFRGYPGFRAFPYPEYSETFFGAEYRVLRGGSWATRPGAIRGTFRNWDFLIRRQIFAGFRCARDA